MRTPIKVNGLKLYAHTGWTVEDVMSSAEGLDIKLSEEEAKDFLVDNGRHIEDAMVERGWQAIEDFLFDLNNSRPKGGRK